MDYAGLQCGVSNLPCCAGVHPQQNGCVCISVVIQTRRFLYVCRFGACIFQTFSNKDMNTRIPDATSRLGINVQQFGKEMISGNFLIWADYSQQGVPKHVFFKLAPTNPWERNEVALGRTILVGI